MVYYNGSVWSSNNFGKFEIIGKSNKIGYYFCEFKDGTVVSASSSNIKRGKVKNPNHPTVCGIGYIGQGNNKVSIKGVHTKEYTLWRSVIYRCYSVEYHKKNKSYIGTTCDTEFHSFQYFADFIKTVDGYVDGLLNLELDKDIIGFKIGKPKHYGKSTIKFVTKEENFNEMINRVYRN